MSKIILNKQQVSSLIQENRYKVNPKTKFVSRCIDGRYPTSENLPALATSGADAGEMAAIFATANIYGFGIDMEKTLEALTKIVGGDKNLRVHTDDHSKELMAGCGHVKNATEDLKSYNFTLEQADFIKNKFKSSHQVTLHGEHLEGAVLIIQGGWGVMPQQKIETEEGQKTMQVFIFHKSLVDERHRALARALIEKKAVSLPPNCDEEYLYQVLSTTTEDHLMETAKRLANGLPIYAVSFNEEGKFKIEEQGVV